MANVDGVAFVTYEAPFSPCGGIASVMKYLPDALYEVGRLRTIVLTPFHYQLPQTQALRPYMTLQGIVSVPYRGRRLQVHIMRVEVPRSEVEWYAFLPEEERFFSGRRHPYDVDTSRYPEANLLEDTLLFGQAVVRSLHVLGPGMHWALLMQDWEGATAALCSQSHHHDLYLTLHNSYDSGSVHDDLLQAFGYQVDCCVGSRDRATVLDRALRLVKKPIFTVSKGFALELREDPFQREVMIPHLQSTLVCGGTPQVLGLDNGPFSALRVPIEVLFEAKDASPAQALTLLMRWKRVQRQAFFEALRRLHETERKNLKSRYGFGTRHWGDVEGFLEAEEKQLAEGSLLTPWFVMGGRDDPRQKGFDVAAQATRHLLEEGLDARFLFFPLPGDEGLNGLKFLADLAWDFPQRVLVFPFFFRDGYMAALQGSTFALMPSFYEPFGAANEFYLNGTVGIGRATGGLVQQIVPLRPEQTGLDWTSCSPGVIRRAERWHKPDARPTGILFREREALPTAVEDWRSINDAHYAIGGGGPDRIKQREAFALWREMVRALVQAIRDADALYRQETERYGQMLLDGIAHIQTQFSWERTAEDYLRCIAPHALRTDEHQALASRSHPSHLSHASGSPNRT